MDKTRLNIGAYILQEYARSEQHIKDIADCSIDFIVDYNGQRETLDLFEKYGIGAVVNDATPGWWGGDGNDAGKMALHNPISSYEKASAEFTDHPAIWGIDIGDEPSALDFLHYGKAYTAVERLFPNQFAYINLYPNYASVSENSAEQTISQLGTQTYSEHIDLFCQRVPSDHICFDYYPYSSNIPGFYENLKIVADAARNTGRSMWTVLQVNSKDPNMWISENMLRYQAFTSMAYGSQCIIWACYTAGWWHNQVIDNDGNKTAQYDKLAKINKEIKTLAEPYMRYRRSETYHIGIGDDITRTSDISLNTGVFFNVKAEDDSPLIIGQMSGINDSHKKALMICSAKSPKDTDDSVIKITFSVEKGRSVFATSNSGKAPVTVDKNGCYVIETQPNHALFIEAR